jgi:hypothetical protein
MDTIRLKTKVKPDGSLQLQLQDLPPNQDIEILLVYQSIEKANPPEPTEAQDPLIGLFSGNSDLGEQSEEILQQDIHNKSGWTWKKS